jgi:hypothetical protein
MGYANIAGNTLLDDHTMEIADLPFSEQAKSKFRDQIDFLEAQRCKVPTGWQHIYNHTIRMLRAVDCPQRDGIEFSEPVLVRGAILVQIYYVPTDKVVRGILNKLAKRTDCTCEVCGRGQGAMYRVRSDQTLCARCHVQTDLDAELDRWLRTTHLNKRYRERPIIEFASLPTNIQLLIPVHKLNKLRLVSQASEITYVQPATILAQSKLLNVMQQYLDQIKLEQ